MKKVLVTGASSGIGLEIARQLANLGSQVTLVARSADKLKEIIPSLNGSGHQYVRADLSRQVGIDNIVQTISEGDYDVMINNAGVGIYGRFNELNLESQMKMLTLNINAVVALSYAFLKIAKPGNKLMNMASTLGLSSFPGAAAYAGTKGFVIKFSESLWYEYKGRNVYIVAFCPGATSTDFHQTASGGSEVDFPDMLVQTPEQVAHEAIRALQNPKKPTVVSGLANRIMVSTGHFIGSRQWVNFMGNVSPVIKS